MEHFGNVQNINKNTIIEIRKNIKHPLRAWSGGIKNEDDDFNFLVK